MQCQVNADVITTAIVDDEADTDDDDAEGGCVDGEPDQDIDIDVDQPDQDEDDELSQAIDFDDDEWLYTNKHQLRFEFWKKHKYVSNPLFITLNAIKLQYLYFQLYNINLVCIVNENFDIELMFIFQ